MPSAEILSMGKFEKTSVNSILVKAEFFSPLIFIFWKFYPHKNAHKKVEK